MHDIACRWRHRVQRCHECDSCAGGARVVAPADPRQKYGIRVGDTLVWRDGEHGLVLQSRSAGIRRAQAIAAKYKKPGVSVVDELIRERRADAARD